MLLAELLDHLHDGLCAGQVLLPEHRLGVLDALSLAAPVALDGGLQCADVVGLRDGHGLAWLGAACGRAFLDVHVDGRRDRR